MGSNQSIMRRPDCEGSSQWPRQHTSYSARVSLIVVPPGAGRAEPVASGSSGLHAHQREEC